MNVPAPTEEQARILWFSLTALAVGVMVALLGLLLWSFGWVVQQLSSVILPLAIAGIIAYLLDPVVDSLERRRIPRFWAIWIVFLLAIAIVGIVLAIVVPQLVVEARQLIEQLPHYASQLKDNVEAWAKHSRFVKQAQTVWSSEFADSVQGWFAKAIPIISGWLAAHVSRVASWFGLIIGLVLVPVYTFYLLLEKEGIERSWTDYLPIHESRLKQETVFVIEAINGYLILFFRGQVLVAMCDGLLLTIGFFVIGLNYALLLGMVAGLLSIVPFLGIILSLIPAMILAAVQFGDWLHPLLVAGLFALVQTIEGLFISPKIMGNRVGLHPLTIMIAVMVGTTLLGNILGGILAIPLTAALRVLMFRYVWKRPQASFPRARRSVQSVSE